MQLFSSRDCNDCNDCTEGYNNPITTAEITPVVQELFTAGNISSCSVQAASPHNPAGELQGEPAVLQGEPAVLQGEPAVLQGEPAVLQGELGGGGVAGAQATPGPACERQGIIVTDGNILMTI